MVNMGGVERLLDTVGLSILGILNIQMIPVIAVVFGCFFMARRRLQDGGWPQLEAALKVALATYSLLGGIVVFAAFVMTTPPAVCARFEDAGQCIRVCGLSTATLRQAGVVLSIVLISYAAKSLEVGFKVSDVIPRKSASSQLEE